VQCLPSPSSPLPLPPPEEEDSFIEQTILALDSLDADVTADALEESGLLNELPGPSTLLAPINEAWDNLPECVKAALAAPQPLRNQTLRRLLKTLIFPLRHWTYAQFADPLNEGKVFPTWLDSYREPADAQLPSQSFGLEVVFKKYPQVMTDPGYIKLPQPEKQVCFQGVPADGSPMACIILADSKNTSMLITHLVDNFPFGNSLCPVNATAPAPAPMTLEGMLDPHAGVTLSPG